MKQPYKYTAIISLLLLLTFLLYPLTSSTYQLIYDSAKIEKKKAFLDEEVSPLDSIKRPNIVLLVADDLGFMDISLHGSQLVNTQFIDKIAQKGVNFTKAYATAPSCSPSRAGLMTGRYQNRFGFESQMQERYLRNRLEYYVFTYFMDSKPWNIKFMDKVPREEDKKRQGLPPTEITLAEMLKKQGYKTGIFGKWHLGSADFNVPHHMGFDEHYGFYASHSLYAYEGTEGIVDQYIPEDWSDQHIWAFQRDNNAAIVRNGEILIEKEYLTERIKEEALDFLDRNHTSPFFLYVPFSTPHTPLQVPQKYYDRFSHIKDPYKRIYNAMIANLDDAIGAVTDKIDDLGIGDNTLLIFISDNGGATYTFTTDNAPLKGGKITFFEGGVRIPFMMKWPGVLPENVNYGEAVSTLDIFTTICAAAGAELPDDRVYDGANLIPFLKNEKEGMPHQVLFWKTGVNRVVLQNGWKLFFNKAGTREQTMLFDLSKDPYETTNLAEQFPDKVETLKAFYNEWEADFPPALWPPIVTFEFSDGEETYFFDI